MTELLLLLDEYIATRRALGTKLKEPAHLLKQFTAFVTRQGGDYISTELAVEWATEPRHAQPKRWAQRLAFVRGFAHYANAVDPNHEVPPQGLPHRYCRRQPYIYCNGEVLALISAAQGLSGSDGLRSSTHATLLGLLTVTGMRISEALNLDRDDVDLSHGILTVRDSKFGKARLLPIHGSSKQSLSRYASLRDRLCPNPEGAAFFPNRCGARMACRTVQWTFVKLSRQTGLRGSFDSHGPRLIDLRHTFAVNTLLNWYRNGVDVESKLLHLATYLGHARVSDTYWYLTATPELLQLAAQRVDHATGRLY